MENSDTSRQFSNLTPKGDMHIHLEGMAFDHEDIHTLREVFRRFYANQEISNEFERLTSTKIKNLDINFEKLFTEGRKTYPSFDEFLQRLYYPKLILASGYDFVYKYTFRKLANYFAMYSHIRLGISVALPDELSYLDSVEWNKAIFHAIEDIHIIFPLATLELIVEAKRGHFHKELSEGKPLSDSYVNFINQAKARFSDCEYIKIGLSVCDNAIKHPLFNDSYQQHFDRYMDLTNGSDVEVSMHLLENLPALEFTEKKFRRIIEKNALYELDYYLDYLDKKNFKGANLIHMSNLFEGAEVNPVKRTKIDNAKVKRGMKYLDEISARNHRIVLCLSSNDLLKTKFLLDYPEICNSIVEGQLQCVLGSDDPGIFGFESLGDEIEKVDLRIQKNAKRYGKKYSDNFTGRLLEKLIENSYRTFDRENNEWK